MIEELTPWIQRHDVQLAVAFVAGAFACLLVVFTVRMWPKPPPEARFGHEHDPLELDNLPPNIAVRYRILQRAMVDGNQAEIIRSQAALCRGRWLVPDRLSVVQAIVRRHGA